jgi:hypothetical protein
MGARMREQRAWAVAWSVLRFVIAAAIVAAIVGQLIRSVGISADKGWPIGPTVIDFFSFFTIASNCGSVVALTIGGVIGLSRARVDPRWFAVLLACVSTYMLITGLVYNLLLRNIPLPQGSTVPWSNEILHVWAPLFLLLDVVSAPKRRVVSWSTLGAIVAFPVVWIVYTLIRGPLVHDFRTGNDWWYPYPFLNPHVQAWGYGGVAIYVLAIAIAVVGVGALVVAASRRFGVRPAMAPVSADRPRFPLP